MSYAHRATRPSVLALVAAALAFALLPALASAGGKGHGHHHAKVHHAKSHGHHGKRHHHHDKKGHHHGHGGHGHHGGSHGKGKVVNTMTRNLYLGADLGPAIGAPSLEAFVAANGQILREVTANNFPLRARGLAQEILRTKPDLVGLQEVALWRTAPPSLEPVQTGVPTATTVRYD